MKETKFERKDGSEGVSYHLEVGDEVVSRFSAPRNNPSGKYDNWSLGITTKDGKEIYVRLTGGQAKKLLNCGDLLGKTLKAVEYTNDYGTHVGIQVV